MQHVQVQGKSAGLHCPSHRDICTVRLHKQARIISSTPTHPGHASPPCLWKEILASSIRNYQTNSFIPQAAGAVAPSPPAPPNSFQPRTDSQHTHTRTIPTHTHNHVDVSCLTLLFNKLCSFFPLDFSLPSFQCVFIVLPFSLHGELLRPVSPCKVVWQSNWHWQGEASVD